MKDPKRIVIHKNKIIARLECPSCRVSFIKPIDTVEVECSACKKKVNAFVSGDAFNFYAPLILKKLRVDNKVILNASSYNLKELQSIQYYFDGLDLEMTKLEKKEIEIEKSECDNCGLCNNCCECSKCKTHYVYSENKGSCPKCGSTKFNKSFIKGFEKEMYDKIEKSICPYCKSLNIRKTWFDKKLKTCPRCNSKKIPKKKRLEVNEIVFEKKPRNIL